MAYPRLFHVTISTAENGSYNVSAGSVSNTVIWAPSALFWSQLQYLHDRGPDRLKDYSNQESIATELGRKLFETFFTGTVLDSYRVYRKSTASPRLALHLPRQLFELPWETLCGGTTIDPDGQFLSLFGSLTRIDAESTNDSNAIIVDSPTSTQDTFLFVLSSPSSRPVGDIKPKSRIGKIKFKSVRPATFSIFQRLLRQIRPTGIVFFGHGKIVDSKGTLVFIEEQSSGYFSENVDDPKRGESIANAIGPDTNIAHALILACEGAWVHDGIRFDNTIAGAMLSKTWLRYVTAAQTPFDLRAMREFLEGAVEGLSEGLPIDLAIANGRMRVHAIDPTPDSRYSHLDWWVPVLYARESSIDALQESPETCMPRLIDRGEPRHLAVPKNLRFSVADAASALVSSFGGLLGGDK